MKRLLPLLGLSVVAIHGALAAAEPAVAGADPALTPGLADYQREALTRNPSLRAKQPAIARADEEVRSARAGYSPQIDASARYTWRHIDGLDLGDLGNPAYAALEARVSSARSAYDVIAKKYAAGTVSQLEVIAARTALLQAGTDQITAVTDYYLRLAELDRVTESTGVSR